MNHIVNHTIGTANVWEEVALGLEQSIYSLDMQARTAVNFLYKYSLTPTTYFTVKSGDLRTHLLTVPRKTRLFVQCATLGTVIEIEMKTQP